MLQYGMVYSSAAALCAGVAAWPALEYLLHRVLAHTVGFGNKFKTEHLRHHRDADYFAGAKDKLLAAAPGVLIAFLGARALGGGGPAALAFAAGFLCSYLVYEWRHKRFHTHPPRSAWGLVMRKHHLLHHCADARVNHGVTTRLFDRLFGTFAERERVLLPRALAPRWLLDASGAVAKPYRGDFALR